MQTGIVTTPFGRRPITLDFIKRQMAVNEIRSCKSADKWKIFRDISSAMTMLGIQPNSLAVLDALLSFYPDNELRQGAQLIVFPSNVQLSLRAHQMSGATVRRHLSALVEAGLILRRDSANGKRYARKDGDGQIESAFGFDLSPLLTRSQELAAMAQQVSTERAEFKRAKEDLTICRRNVRKLITAAISENADGDWRTIEAAYVALSRCFPRSPSISDLSDLHDKMERLQTEVLKRLEIQLKTRNESTNDALTERHIQDSKPESLNEFEHGSGRQQELKPQSDHLEKGLKSFPLSLVLKACPAIANYGPNGGVASWRELMSAAVVVRSMLGVTPSAYHEACQIMGPENAATAIACILERANVINSSGGYLRDLARRSRNNKFSLGPMIMALLKVNGGLEKPNSGACKLTTK